LTFGTFTSPKPGTVPLLNESVISSVKGWASGGSIDPEVGLSPKPSELVPFSPPVDREQPSGSSASAEPSPSEANNVY